MKKKVIQALCFTLIESLVVIILAAMLFPALQQVQKRGRSVCCLGNLKQVSFASSQYPSDHGSFTVQIDISNANGNFLCRRRTGIRKLS